MAYFPNGSAGMVFDEQCSICRYGDKPCPIAFVQMKYNYKACNDEVASDILNDLVKDDGTCEMYKAFEKDFESEAAHDERVGQLRIGQEVV